MSEYFNSRGETKHGKGFNLQIRVDVNAVQVKKLGVYHATHLRGTDDTERPRFRFSAKCGCKGGDVRTDHKSVLDEIR
jgi:hypothetical protein